MSEPLKKNQDNHAHGGRRPNAGRKPGTANKSNEEARRKAAETGETPLEYMLRVMRDSSTEHDRRDDMAKAAASYVHSRLSSSENKTEVVHRFVARVPNKAENSTTWQLEHEPKIPTIQ